MTEYPPIEELIPHAGEMVFLSSVLEHAEDRTVCLVEIDRQALFRSEDGSVPAWIGIEFMAQCIAAHAGLVAQARKTRARVGFLLGSRRVTLHVPRYSRGQRLWVTAAQAWGRSAGMVAFDCRIEGEGGGVLAEARLNCFLPDDAEEATVQDGS